MWPSFYLEDLGWGRGEPESDIQQLVLAVAKISKNLQKSCWSPWAMGLIRERYRFMISDRSRLNNTIVCLQGGKPNDKPTIWGAFVTHPIKIGNVGDGLWLGLPRPCHINSLQFASQG